MLLQISDLSISIQQRKEVIAELRSLYATVSAVRYDSIRVSSTATSDKLLDVIGKLEEMEKDLAAEVESLSVTKRQVLKLIDSLGDPVQKQVLYLRYVRLDNESRPMQFHVIADRLSYSYRQILRIHASGLAAIDKMSLNVT